MSMPMLNEAQKEKLMAILRRLHPKNETASADSEHWVTVEGGQHVLVDGDGQVLSGIGIDKGNKAHDAKVRYHHWPNIKTKSKDVDKAPKPNFTAKPTAPHPHAEARKASERADNLSKHAQSTEEHIEAMNAHYGAHEEWGKLDGSLEKSQARLHHKEQYDAHAEEVKRLDQEAADKQKNDAVNASEIANNLTEKAKTLEDHEEALEAHQAALVLWVDESVEGAGNRIYHREKIKEHTQKIAELKTKNAVKAFGGGKFEKHTATEIHDHFKNKYGIGFANGEPNLKKEMDEEWRNYHKTGNAEHLENYQKLKDRYQLSHGNVKGYKAMDVNANNAGSKDQRRVLHHFDTAMENLEKQGFDMKAATAGLDVQFAGGSVQKHYGLSWQRGNTGYLGVSHVDRSGVDSDEYSQKLNAQQIKYFGSRHSTSSSKPTAEARAHTTMIHELAHAIGLHTNRGSDNSPARLDKILNNMFPNHNARRKWLSKNISQYASTKLVETDAELAAMVASPDYVRGTLPKELEDHVDWLFKKKV